MEELNQYDKQNAFNNFFEDFKKECSIISDVFFGFNETTNICLNCKNNMTTMQQVSCSICLCNKNEISTFNCPCKVVICKECYLKWRKQNNFCPSCRNPII